MEYEKDCVREYWIIDPLSKTIELYRLERKRFQATKEIDGALASSIAESLRHPAATRREIA